MTSGGGNLSPTFATSIGLEEPELPCLFRLAQARDGRFHAAEQLRWGREHRGSHPYRYAPGPVPDSCGGDSFDAINEL